MSMALLTILQTIVIFVVYMTTTCVLPLIIINPLMKNFRLCEKLIMAVVLGNFYVINEVLILQLLHISNQFTLILFIAVPAYYAISRIYGFSGREFAKNCWDKFLKLIKKELGVRLLLASVLKRAGRFIVKILKKCLNVIKRNPIDAVLFLAVTLLLVYMYGENLILHYGYCASDIPVHNYWINYMSRGQLFVNGVYPFGFHCIIYFMHDVFGLETYVMLRVFCFIQTLFIHWTLLLFLKCCLKSRYLAYLGTAAYAALDIFPANTYSRYYASLPQEFGMIFILPAIYFGFAFFKFRKEELKSNGGNSVRIVLKASELETKSAELYCVKLKLFRKIKEWFSDLTPTKWCLIGFAMSFSLTLAVHFYGTMIAGLFCVAMAIGFFFRFFRKKYFWNVVVTCFISVAIAVFPMAAAFATGTPLQGSLGWGMSVIKGDSDTDSTSNIPVTEADAEENNTVTDITVNTGEDGITQAVPDGDNSLTAGNGEASQMLQPAQNQGIVGKVIWAIKNYRTSFLRLRSGINTFISKNENLIVTNSIYYSMAGLAVMSVLFFALRESDYAAQLLSVSIFIFFMNVIIAAGWFNLPRIMDGNRCSIYFCYVLPILWCYVADAVITLLFRWFKVPAIGNTVSLFLICLAVALTSEYDLMRTPYNCNALETNGAITCLSNIIYGHDDWTWTICSANDELRMGEDYGYHYETIDLLREIENIGRHAGVTIPTKYTYFFVEKIPVDYTVYYEDLGQSISKAGAREDIPYGGGLGPYMGRNRWIVMSRMYYWAEEFMRLHPGNMSVYYESDEFICYQLIQNVDSLFELGIDYGYNNFSNNY